MLYPKHYKNCTTGLGSCSYFEYKAIRIEVTCLTNTFGQELPILMYFLPLESSMLTDSA
jgi:hypothetical protein